FCSRALGSLLTWALWHDLLSLAPLGCGRFGLGPVFGGECGNELIELVVSNAISLGDEAPFGRLDGILRDTGSFGVNVAETVLRSRDALFSRGGQVAYRFRFVDLQAASLQEHDGVIVL